jgi:alpha-L-fucosidase
MTDPPLHPLSPEELLLRYYTTVGQNTTMLIGMAIDSAGTFSERDRLAFEEFGGRVKSIFASPAAGKKGEGRKLVLNVADPGKTITHLVVCEDIVHGERIRAYQIEKRTNGRWEILCEGTSVGHKKIHKIIPTEAIALRLKVTESKGKPMIREFTAYY